MKRVLLAILFMILISFALARAADDHALKLLTSFDDFGRYDFSLQSVKDTRQSIAKIAVIGEADGLKNSAKSKPEEDKRLAPKLKQAEKKVDSDIRVAVLFKNEMLFVKGGCFQMGDTFGNGGGWEKPAHEVCVSDFYIGKYEVTQKEWRDVMGSSPSHFSKCGDDCPVEQVSWDDVQDFIRRLNQKTGAKHRLPTEAEWEYAARSGGQMQKWAGTSSESSLTNYAWYEDNASRKTHPVGQKKPNRLGLYDMSGNVWEWVGDWFGSYSGDRQDNPTGSGSGDYRVFRGGSWNDIPRYVRAADREANTPDLSVDLIGFRLASSMTN